jgi:hypothetical protein
MDSKPTYSQAEVNEIIRRALDKQSARQDHLDHDDLVAIADEVGIDQASLERATAEIAKDRDRSLAHDDDAKAVAAERTIQLRSFLGALVSHAIMNAAFYVIDTQFFGGIWFKWPLLGSVILLAFRLRRVLAPQEPMLRRRRREERRRAREQRHAAWTELKQRVLPNGPTHPTHATQLKGKEFERVVETGVAALLDIAARKLDEHTKAGRRK